MMCNVCDTAHAEIVGMRPHNGRVIIHGSKLLPMPLALLQSVRVRRMQGLMLASCAAVAKNAF